MKKHFLGLSLFIGACILVWAFTVVYIQSQCHNQCARGDRACQDRCFKHKFCPQEDQ
jgi:hypothetical protein